MLLPKFIAPPLGEGIGEHLGKNKPPLLCVESSAAISSPIGQRVPFDDGRLLPDFLRQKFPLDIAALKEVSQMRRIKNIELSLVFQLSVDIHGDVEQLPAMPRQHDVRGDLSLPLLASQIGQHSPDVPLILV